MSILTLKVPELIRGIIRGAGEGTIVFSPTLFIFSVSGGKEGSVAKFVFDEFGIL